MILLLAANTFAQRLDGTLRGLVTDPQGAVVSGAKVTAEKDGTGVVQTTETSNAGTYVFPNLLTGNYTVTVEASGFQKFTRRNVQVSSNQVVEAPARLTVGDAGTTVEVVAGAELVQTETSQLGNTFNQRQVTELPVLNGNNVLNLAILAPNVTSQGGGILGTGGAVGGTRPRMNSFTVDGLDDNDLSVTGPTSAVVQDAVSEFSLLTNQFSAEYGHSAGGQFNLVTKSGTNSWHGTAAHFLSNRKLLALDNQEKDADRDPATPGITRENGLQPRFDSNFTSGTLGGAIIKNKVFVFGALEHQGFGFPGAAPSFDAPTATGLANLRLLAENAAILEILDQFPVAPSEGRVISVTNFNSATTLPVGVGSTTIFTPSFQNLWNWHANGDINLGRHQIRLRYLNNTFASPNDANIPLPQFSGALTAFAKKATINHIWAVNDRFINDFRLGYTRAGNTFGVSAAFLNFPNVHSADLSDFNLGPQENSPQGEANNTYQLIEQMTYARGRHTLKWGVEGRRWIAVSSFLPRGRGEWRYADLTQFVNDFVPTTLAKRGAGNPASSGNQSAFYAFFQDDFKVTPRLTLNLGMRYEWQGVPALARTQVLNAISKLPGVYDFRAPTSDKNNWAPRLGFAWDPSGSGKWAIRGGFGMSYDVVFHNFYSTSLPPQLQSEQDPDISCALPGAPSWCAGYDSTTWATGGNTGQGFLAGNGLLQVNVPCASQADCRASTSSHMVDQVSPTIYTWTLSAQRQLHRTNSIEVRYLGTQSTLLPVQIQTNSRTAFAFGARPLPVFFNAADIPTDFTGGPTLAEFNSFISRPFLADNFFGPVTSFKPVGEAIYHAISADFVQRAWRGMSLRANYTFAKTFDDSTNEFNSSAVNPRRPEDADNLSRERGRSALDINHKFALSWIYDLPKVQTDSGILRKLLHGWQLGGTYLNQSGQPVTLRSARDLNGNLDSAGDRALINPNASGTGATDLGFVCWSGAVVTTSNAACGAGLATVGYLPIDPTAHFVRGRTGVLTNVGRNTISSPGYNIANISIFKNTHITESKYLQFRLEMFNAFNHRNFSFADPGVFGLNGAAQDNGDFSRVGSADFLDEKALNGGNRLIQLAVKFVF
ncbi:MAG: TonB-dependent receptor domain-containing protein [Terriglobales bacterium]